MWIYKYIKNYFLFQSLLDVKTEIPYKRSHVWNWSWCCGLMSWATFSNNRIPSQYQFLSWRLHCQSSSLLMSRENSRAWSGSRVPYIHVGYLEEDPHSWFQTIPAPTMAATGERINRWKVSISLPNTDFQKNQIFWNELKSNTLKWTKNKCTPCIPLLVGLEGMLKYVFMVVFLEFLKMIWDLIPFCFYRS